MFCARATLVAHSALRLSCNGRAGWQPALGRAGHQPGVAGFHEREELPPDRLHQPVGQEAAGHAPGVARPQRPEIGAGPEKAVGLRERVTP
jgi:hypothetical protein